MVGFLAQFIPDEFGCRPYLIIVFLGLFVFSL